MRSLLKLAAVAALGMAGAVASPVYAASGSLWDHNGSKMTLEEDGAKRKILYTEPREGLDKAGIRPGTVLFDGARKPDGRFAGNAKIFKGTCNPIDYFVEGTVDERKGEIVLQGQAPVYAAQGCEISGYSDTSAASTLTFTSIGAPPESAAVAPRQPEDQFEQGDRGPADQSYLPPASADRSARRTQPDADPFTRRAPLPRADEDERDLDDLPPRERRYGRAPDDRFLDRPLRRRPGIYDPEDDFATEDDLDEEIDRPFPPFWGPRRRF